MDRLSAEIRTRILGVAAEDSSHPPSFLAKLSLVSRSFHATAQTLLFKQYSRLVSTSGAAIWLRSPLSSVAESLSIRLLTDWLALAFFSELQVESAHRKLIAEQVIRRPNKLVKLEIHITDGIQEAILLENNLKHVKHLKVTAAEPFALKPLAALLSAPFFHLTSLSIDANASITLLKLLAPALQDLAELSLEDTTDFPAMTVEGEDEYDDPPFLLALDELFFACRDSLKSVTVTQLHFTEDDDYVMGAIERLPALERFEHRGALCTCCTVEFMATTPASVTSVTLLEDPVEVAPQMLARTMLDPFFPAEHPHILPNLGEVVLPLGARTIIQYKALERAKKRGIEVRFVEYSGWERHDEDGHEDDSD
ncbi:hypothetical protein JCM3770_003361 [Rhodotorula araucariae]